MSSPVNKTIAVLSGDGIGPEVVRQGLKVLNAVSEKYRHTFTMHQGFIGGAAIERTGMPLPPETLSICQDADAVLLGAVGLPEYDRDPNTKVRPEQGLLGIRKSLQLYLNIRPVVLSDQMTAQSPLKEHLLNNIDFVIYRELSGGIYYGEKTEATDEHMVAMDICSYSGKVIRKVVKAAFKAARQRKGKLCLVDKANVLATSRLWRRVVMEMASKFPGVDVQYMYVDNAAMQMVLNPAQFDVIVTSNMFGDILSDLGSAIVGSLGLLPSASLGSSTALFEPVHGSYPQAAGKDIANPLATILSVKMMMEYFELFDEAADIEAAVNLCIEKNIGTPDMNMDHEFECSKLGELISYMVAHDDFQINIDKQGAVSGTII